MALPRLEDYTSKSKAYMDHDSEPRRVRLCLIHERALFVRALLVCSWQSHLATRGPNQLPRVWRGQAHRATRR